MNSNSLLSRINSPVDLKSLSVDELPALAGEIRSEIVKVVSKNGGHLASNLGVVELSIVLHRLFSSPRDKIIWDVGHQCYAHKILTGRRDNFHTLRLNNGLSGFPKRLESEHDIIETGHASTSISTGLGLLLGEEFANNSGKVIVVIGDGALTGGMALEALNHAGYLSKNLIIVINDNNMSIGPNVSALSHSARFKAVSTYLSRITATKYYQNIRDRIDRGLKVVPFFGYWLFDFVMKFKKGIKAVVLQENIFTDLGYKYYGPIDGHSFSRLSLVFKNVQKINGPVIVHVITKKGKGYSPAEGDPSLYHGVSPFSIEDGKIERKSSLTFTEVFSDSIVKEAETDNRIIAITAAMTEGTGVASFRNRFPERFFDVGIAEQHAVAFAAGLAASGLKPVVAVYSTFMQRAVDQVIHDVALPGLPVVFAMDRAGLVENDGETHQGVYDITLFRSVPGLTFLAPAGTEELALMLQYALKKNSPVMLRYPKAPCISVPGVLSLPIEEGRGVFIHESGEEFLVISVGGMFQEVVEAGNILNRDGIHTDIYNLRFIKPIDQEFLINIIKRYSYVLLVEDGARLGGIGEQISSIVQANKLDTDFQHIGVPDTFISQASREELFLKCKIDRASIADKVKTISKQKLRIIKQKASGS